MTFVARRRDVAVTREDSRGLSGLFHWTTRKTDKAAAASSPAPATVDAPEIVVVSKVFPRFLSPLNQRSSVVLLDLGPVVGGNIAFFGDRLDCKIHVLDLFAEVETFAKRDNREGLSAAMLSRLSQEPGTIDAILCWDLFDFLDRPTAQLVAGRLTSLLRSGGLVYAFFGTTSTELRQYTRFLVEGEDMMRLRTSPATPVQRQVLQPRDMLKIFAGLAVTESVLLKSNTRETLLRKS